jgi:hypothetical protein
VLSRYKHCHLRCASNFCFYFIVFFRIYLFFYFFLKFFIHLFMCAYIVWAIFPSCLHSPASRQNLFCPYL